MHVVCYFFASIHDIVLIIVSIIIVYIYITHFPRASIATRLTSSGTCHTLRRCSTIRDSWPLSMPLPIRYGSHTVHEVYGERESNTYYLYQI